MTPIYPASKDIDASKVSKEDVENMLYLIAAYGTKKEAKKFDRLSFAKQQKITLILQRRLARRGNGQDPLDFYTIREVIDDARLNIYILD